MVIDVVSGVAKPASAAPPPVIVSYKDHRWEVAQVEGRVIARAGKRLAWQHEASVHGDDRRGVPAGAVADDPRREPRCVRRRARARPARHRCDGLDERSGAFPVPGIGLLGFGTSSIGDVALAVRLDTSLAARLHRGLRRERAADVGVPATADARARTRSASRSPREAVVVFHDGETVTVLPELSAPPTAPGAARAPSENPTP